MNIDDPMYDGVLAVADWSDEYEENLTYHQCFPALDRLRLGKRFPSLIRADCVLCDADRWVGSAEWKDDQREIWIGQWKSNDDRESSATNNEETVQRGNPDRGIVILWVGQQIIVGLGLWKSGNPLKKTQQGKSHH